MASEKSVTHWIHLLKEGDRAAVQPLWERYFQKLVRLARRKLQGTPRRAADEEDVALSAFDSFCRHAKEKRFPQLEDRADLWRLLVVFTARKAWFLARHEHRQKRGGAKVLGEKALEGNESTGPGLGQILDQEPTPQFAVQLAEECNRLLQSLPNDELRSLALMKLEGFSNKEISGKLCRTTRTVERKLCLIRSLWGQETPED